MPIILKIYLEKKIENIRDVESEDGGRKKKKNKKMKILSTKDENIKIAMKDSKQSEKD